MWEGVGVGGGGNGRGDEAQMGIFVVAPRTVDACAERKHATVLFHEMMETETCFRKHVSVSIHVTRKRKRVSRKHVSVPLNLASKKNCHLRPTRQNLHSGMTETEMCFQETCFRFRLNLWLIVKK